MPKHLPEGYILGGASGKPTSNTEVTWDSLKVHLRFTKVTASFTLEHALCLTDLLLFLQMEKSGI